MTNSTDDFADLMTPLTQKEVEMEQEAKHRIVSMLEARGTPDQWRKLQEAQIQGRSYVAIEAELRGSTDA